MSELSSTCCLWLPLFSMSSSDEDIKLLFLQSGSHDVLPSSCIKLRSYLNLHLSNIADQHNLKLIKSFRNRNKACPYCYSPWSVETTSLKLLPSQKHKAKVQNETTGSDKPLLKESRNTLILRCKVCTKKSSFSLVKKKTVKPVQEENLEAKKKKKKKNKSCGLTVGLLKTPTESQPSQIKSEVPIVKRKKKKKGSKDSGPVNSQNAQSSFHKPIPISSESNTKKLLPNPFAVQKGFSKKNDKKLEKLKQAVKEEKVIFIRISQNIAALLSELFQDQPHMETVVQSQNNFCE